jgi:hypothetical protein
MLDNDWEIIRNNASKALRENTIFKSFRQGREYKIRVVQEKRIFIDRISGGKTAVLTKGKVCKAIEILKKSKRIAKGELIHSVVRETMLICLHPEIKWDSNTNELFWDNNMQIQNSLDLAIKFVGNASDDDLEKITVEINKRRNQSKFRKALLNLYNHKCAITSTGPDIVLQAAHIISHAKSGINSNENGILLRSDLHVLFDNDLLLIHPINLTIHIHPSLRLTHYFKYDGKNLLQRKDKSKPNLAYLKEKWINSTWADKLS